MNAVEQSTAEPGAQAINLSFSAIELGKSAALGADVRLELSPRTTVLVGKNGAGKSVLIEKMHAAIWGAAGAVMTADPDPARFACEIEASDELGGSLKLRYECGWRPREEETESTSEVAMPRTSELQNKVEESCWIVGAENRLLWRVDDGVITYNTGERAEIAAGRTLLNWTISRGQGTFLFPYMADPLERLFLRVVRIPAGIPRGDVEREELALPYPEPLRERGSTETRRIRWLIYRLANWHERVRDRFDELVELGRRTGLLEEVKVKMYRDPEAKRTAHRRDLVSVLVDGTDLGLLSDGTLRVLEILLWLITPHLKLLLVEEPETAVHPGLLSKLLAEIAAYSADRQIVLSTQSPHVVSWADPLAIRLVERRSGRSDVRRLSEKEIGHLSGYLHEEGTLGDFVYSGALDG